MLSFLPRLPSSSDQQPQEHSKPHESHKVSSVVNFVTVSTSTLQDTQGPSLGFCPIKYVALWNIIPANLLIDMGKIFHLSICLDKQFVNLPTV